jgi:hypothetical protein
MNMCSQGVSIDDKGRVWTVSLNRQMKEEEKVYRLVDASAAGVIRRTVGNTDLRTTDIFKLEIFAPDGVLLGEIPVDHFVDGIRIIRNHLFILDRDRGVKYYQYKIIEK